MKRLVIAFASLLSASVSFAAYNSFAPDVIMPESDGCNSGYYRNNASQTCQWGGQAYCPSGTTANESTQTCVTTTSCTPPPGGCTSSYRDSASCCCSTGARGTFACVGNSSSASSVSSSSGAVGSSSSTSSQATSSSMMSSSSLSYTNLPAGAFIWESQREIPEVHYQTLTFGKIYRQVASYLSDYKTSFRTFTVTLASNTYYGRDLLGTFKVSTLIPKTLAVARGSISVSDLSSSKFEDMAGYAKVLSIIPKSGFTLGGNVQKNNFVVNTLLNADIEDSAITSTNIDRNKIQVANGSQTCAAGELIRGFSIDGTVICQGVPKLTSLTVNNNNPVIGPSGYTVDATLEGTHISADTQNNTRTYKFQYDGMIVTDQNKTKPISFSNPCPGNDTSCSPSTKMIYAWANNLPDSKKLTVSVTPKYTYTLQSGSRSSCTPECGKSCPETRTSDQCIRSDGLNVGNTGRPGCESFQGSDTRDHNGPACPDPCDGPNPPESCNTSGSTSGGGTSGGTSGGSSGGSDCSMISCSYTLQCSDGTFKSFQGVTYVGSCPESNYGCNGPTSSC